MSDERIIGVQIGVEKAVLHFFEIHGKNISDTGFELLFLIFGRTCNSDSHIAPSLVLLLAHLHTRLASRAHATQAAQHRLDIVIQRQPLQRRCRVRFARRELVNAAAEANQTGGSAVR